MEDVIYPIFKTILDSSFLVIDVCPFSLDSLSIQYNLYEF